MGASVLASAVPWWNELKPREQGRVVTVTDDGVLILWSARDRCLVTSSRTGVSVPITLEAHPDGRRVLLADVDGTVEVWDLSCGQLDARMALPPSWEHLREPALDMALIQGGRFALVTTVEHDGPDCFQVLYSLETYQHVGFHHMGPGPIELVAGTSSEGLLFEASNRRSWLGARPLERVEGGVVPGFTVDLPQGGWVNSLTMLPEHDMFAAAHDDGNIRIWAAPAPSLTPRIVAAVS